LFLNWNFWLWGLLIVPDVAEKNGARAINKFLSAQENAGRWRVEKYHKNASQHAKKLDQTSSDAKYRHIGRPSPLCVARQKKFITPIVVIVRVIDITGEAADSEDLIIDQHGGTK
jgi:hypothetical protein